MAARPAVVHVDVLERNLKHRLETLTGFGTDRAKATKLKKYFEKYDTNKSGVVTQAMFLGAMKDLNFIDCDPVPIFKKYDQDHSGVLEYEDFCEAFFGLRVIADTTDHTTRSVINKVRFQIANRGGMHGIRTLAVEFKSMDNDGSGRLNFEDLSVGLREFGVEITDAQTRLLLKAFDKNGDGTVDFDEFLRGIRGKMNERRRNLVLLAFDQLCPPDQPSIRVADLAARYDASFHPDVKAGKKTARQVTMEFAAQFGDTNRDGELTRNEFLEYYKDVSASIDEDDYFELMIRNAWHISGGEGASENTTCLRVLLEFRDGTQQVVEVKNDLGLDTKDTVAIKKKLASQGVDVRNVIRVSTTA
jgi:Ca2+-binding EF-hand superfamily protein